MRSFGIELLHEDVEAVLLLQSVRAWRPGCLLFEGKVHALVAAVLLWMAWLDALDRDTETKPPDREFGEVEQGVGACEGNPIVGADGKRQAALTEQPLEGGEGRLFPGRL
jgi:hypothetical protein